MLLADYACRQPNTGSDGQLKNSWELFRDKNRTDVLLAIRPDEYEPNVYNTIDALFIEL